FSVICDRARSICSRICLSVSSSNSNVSFGSCATSTINALLLPKSDQLILPRQKPVGSGSHRKIQGTEEKEISLRSPQFSPGYSVSNSREDSTRYLAAVT